ncbi:helix-turn-helix transcriptional regulator, partial [Elizabethkingia miricola]
EKTIQESVDLIKSVESEKADTVQRRLVLLSALGIIIILIATGYFIIRIKKKKQKQIAEGQEDIRKLESRVNDAFEEVIVMAKNNDPAFLGRFREVYPDFCQKILMIYPDIVNSEFAFCAYLKLNFSTKEIATYTFVTPSAIQNRKNRLRKKLNIPSDEDIYTWINKIG